MGQSMKEIMQEVGNREKEFLIGQMVENMKAAILMTKNMDLELLNSRTEEYIRVNGSKENNTAVVNSEKETQ